MKLPGNKAPDRAGALYKYSPRMAEAMGLPRTGRLPVAPAPAGHTIIVPPVLPIPAQRKPKK